MRRSIYLAVATVALASSAFAQNVTYTGPNDGLWSVAANWSGGVVPNANTFNVSIPSNLRAIYTLPAAVTLSSFTGGEVRMVTGASSLTVAGQVRGLVDVRAGTFIASSTAVNAIDNLRLFVSGGASASAATSKYVLDRNDFGGAYDVLAADGTGSVLNLSTLNNIHIVRGGNYDTYVVHAANNGSVNLSGVQTVTTDNPDFVDFVDFFVETGGSINLNALTSVTQARFRIVGSSRVDLQACKLEYSIVSPK